jgi:hypothetical protein
LDDCFKAEKLEEGVMKVGSSYDAFYGVAHQDALNQGNKWDIQADCAFVKVLVANDGSWVSFYKTYSTILGYFRISISREA